MLPVDFHRHQCKLLIIETDEGCEIMARVKSGMKYIQDEQGKRVGVIIDIQEYKVMREAMEELESIREYDRAKASGGKTVPFEQAIQEIEKKRK